MADLLGLLLRLADAEFEFVIVGGYAAMAHGSSLMTQDLDLCADFHEQNLLRLNLALEGLHPVHRMTPQQLPLQLTADFCHGLKNLYLDTAAGQLDVLSEIRGIGPYSDVVACSTSINLSGRSVRMLGLDALITAKAALDRPRDKEALLQLKAIRELKHPD